MAACQPLDTALAPAVDFDTRSGAVYDELSALRGRIEEISPDLVGISQRLAELSEEVEQKAPECRDEVLSLLVRMDTEPTKSLAKEQEKWVIISTERAKRPDQFNSVLIEKEEIAGGEKCPFCEGNESLTQPEITALRRPGSRPNGPGWDVRVIPNKFPALIIEGEVNRTGMGIYDMMSGIGAHEVIVETPRRREPMQFRG